jgi:hypothetical protein
VRVKRYAVEPSLFDACAVCNPSGYFTGSDDEINRSNDDDDQDDTVPIRKPAPTKRVKPATKTKARAEKPARSSAPDKSKPRNYVMTLSKIPDLVARVKTNGMNCVELAAGCFFVFLHLVICIS